MTPEWKRELEEALVVTNRIQNRHAHMIEDHQRWLEEHTRWMDRHQAWAEKTDKLVNQLVAAQLASEERLQRLEATVEKFIDSLRRGGNGQG
jgi:hypothetical protein